ncbi:hypothetical protein ACFQY7_18360 [Actinomadura luteofluorescens]|uniref:Putative NBD/HSP70 family sugar kinase n=1 Tax=Actinomadura luteofluorescens TaxID=46163 RepID=A0A7Y9EPQ4_9ACTN|nr:hypothetical protein [Actinomadura luteofluorescens]NYD51658.1 putative NBD/HSP70 family sugar kinase [Actinomadura luteofluorescens]
MTSGCVVALDIGGTRIKAGIVGPGHEVLLDRTRDTGAAEGRTPWPRACSTW